jgi:general secretion pathway protein A
VAGCEKNLFSAGAIRQIISFSKCYPRLINIICDHALLTAFVQGKKKVDARIIKECADDLSITAEKPEPRATENGIFQAIFSLLFYPLRRPMLSLPIYALFLLMLAGMAAYIYFPKLLPSGKASIPLTLEEATKTNTYAIPKPEPVSPAKDPGGSEPDPTTPPEPQTPPAGITQKTAGQQTGVSGIEAPAMSSVELESYLNRTFIIRFLMDSNEFSEDAYDVMNRIARVSKQRTDLTVLVSGYTDSLGSDDYNRRLSGFRATVVKSYLVGQGVAPDRITTSGRGPENPIASNKTREGRAANRRVEIVISD